MGLFINNNIYHVFLFAIIRFECITLGSKDTVISGDLNILCRLFDQIVFKHSTIFFKHKLHKRNKYFINSKMKTRLCNAMDWTSDPKGYTFESRRGHSYVTYCMVCWRGLQYLYSRVHFHQGYVFYKHTVSKKLEMSILRDDLKWNVI